MRRRYGYHETSDCFEYRKKNPYLNQATHKNTCQIFLPKKIPESKISNLKNPSITRLLKSGVPHLDPWGTEEVALIMLNYKEIF